MDEYREKIARIVYGGIAHAVDFDAVKDNQDDTEADAWWRGEYERAITTAEVLIATILNDLCDAWDGIAGYEPCVYEDYVIERFAEARGVDLKKGQG